jgi:hypothetical protein
MSTIKHINSKYLLTHYRKVREQAKKGVEFIIYHRSQPILEVKPYAEDSKSKKSFTWDDFKKYVVPKEVTGPVNAVDMVRKDRS